MAVPSRLMIGKNMEPDIDGCILQDDVEMIGCLHFENARRGSHYEYSVGEVCWNMFFAVVSRSFSLKSSSLHLSALNLSFLRCVWCI